MKATKSNDVTFDSFENLAAVLRDDACAFKVPWTDAWRKEGGGSGEALPSGDAAVGVARSSTEEGRPWTLEEAQRTVGFRLKVCGTATGGGTRGAW